MEALVHAHPRPARCLAGRRRMSVRPSVRVAAAPTPLDVPALKAAVLRAAAGTDRGKTADPNARVAILRAVAALEAAAPATDAALNAGGLSGEWGLIYSGPGEEGEAAAADRSAYEKRTGGLEGPIIQALRPVGKWFVTSTGTAQRIDAAAGTVSNVAAFRLVGGLDGELDVEGTACPAPPGAVTPAVGRACGRARTDVKFTRLALRLGSGGGGGGGGGRGGGRTLLSLPLTAFNPNGWIETTYLDGDLRVSRGDKGSVFVAAKRKKK